MILETDLRGAVGQVVGDAEFPTTAAGITRALTEAGIAVVEVERPTRSARRRAGRSDRLDAYHAARAVSAERTRLFADPVVADTMAH